jgi:predicted nucleic acid-binding protein
MKAYLDTAVLVAASVADHPHHSQSLAALQLVRKKTMIGAGISVAMVFLRCMRF